MRLETGTEGSERTVNQMAEIKLKPCPHCGSEATIAMYPIGYAVECMNFRCPNPNPDPTSKYYLTKEAAAEAWNNRGDGWNDEN